MRDEYLFLIDLEEGKEQDKKEALNTPVQKCEKIIYTICKLVVENSGHKAYSRHRIQQEAFGELIKNREKKDNPVDQFSQAWTQDNNETVNRWKNVLERGTAPEGSVYYYSIKKDKYQDIERLINSLED